MPLVNLPWLMQLSATNIVRYFRNRLTLCLTALIGNRVLDHHRESVATPNPHLSYGELKKLLRKMAQKSQVNSSWMSLPMKLASVRAWESLSRDNCRRLKNAKRSILVFFFLSSLQLQRIFEYLKNPSQAEESE